MSKPLGSTSAPHYNIGKVLRQSAHDLKVPVPAVARKGGVSAREEAFILSEAAQEGGYSSVNSTTGALGRWQVLPSNVAAWTKEALGHSLTPQQFLHSESAQNAVALKVLGDDYQKYGLRGAAAAWYSGQAHLKNDTSPQNGGPSIYAYTESVKGRVAGIEAALEAGSVQPVGGTRLAKGGGFVGQTAQGQGGTRSTIGEFEDNVKGGLGFGAGKAGDAAAAAAGDALAVPNFLADLADPGKWAVRAAFILVGLILVIVGVSKLLGSGGLVFQPGQDTVPSPPSPVPAPAQPSTAPAVTPVQKGAVKPKPKPKPKPKVSAPKKAPLKAGAEDTAKVAAE